MTQIGRLFEQSPDVRSLESSSLFRFDGLYGIEIELEHMRNASSLEMKYWRLVNDGSLRNNGIEFVLTQPLGGADIPRALTELEQTIEKGKFTPSLTDRTSVHVHMDVRELTNTELSKLIILYTIFERVLFQYAGPHRWGNIFCMPIEYAQLQIPVLTSIPEGDGQRFADAIYSGSRGIDRYSALNLLALSRFGSLEFRMHQGEWRAEPLLRWVSILACLKEEARSNDAIPDIHTDISANGPLGYLRKVFGSYSLHLEYDTAVNDIMSGVRLSQDILYNHRMAEEQSKPSVPLKKSQYSNSFKEFLSKYMESSKENSEFNVYEVDPVIVRRALMISSATYQSIVDSGQIEDEDIVSRIQRYIRDNSEEVELEGEPLVSSTSIPVPPPNNTPRPRPTPRPRVNPNTRNESGTADGRSWIPPNSVGVNQEIDEAIERIQQSWPSISSSTDEGDNS